MKINYTFSSSNSPKSFKSYPRGDFDLESGIAKKSRRHKNNPLRMLKAVGNKIQQYLKLHLIMLFLVFLSIGMTVLIILSMHERGFRMMPSDEKFNGDLESYPFHNFRNLVMVAGHSVYTSSSCEKLDKDDAWYLESYQKHPGQAATFIMHIQNGVELTANDDAALLLFSGGETPEECWTKE